MGAVLYIHPRDNVAVSLDGLSRGEEVVSGVTARENIPAGHKAAARAIARGEKVVKYGWPIGVATLDIEPGDWVHTHNVSSLLDAIEDYAYTPETAKLPDAGPAPSFLGYPRANGDAGIRNELWVIPAVGCVSQTAKRIAEAAKERFPGHFTDCVAFSHPFGCSQSGEDALVTRDLIAALAKNANAACVLILGLGCEVNRLSQLMPLVNHYPHVLGFDAQDVSDEVEHALSLIAPFALAAREQKRVPVPVSRLKIGLKCGGSDGFSGLTANPLLGVFCDRISFWGGSCGMTEVPEMFGAERILMNRAASAQIFDAIVSMINGYKDYFHRHDLPVYDNPSPGNKDGGITTLEEKSLGCTHKAGDAAVVDVLPYAGRMSKPGLTLITGPGNDLVACTALAAAGCQLALFTTGRGTPYGGPVPTLKISTNSALALNKPGWIDYDAGALLSGTPMNELADGLTALVLDVCSGTPSKAETLGYREMAILKDGVTQ